MKKVYLSPSTQERNIGVGDYGTEERRMNEIVDLMVPILQDHGILWFRNDPKKDHIAAKNDSNNLEVDIHVAIHSDAGGGRGCTAFTSGSSEGRILANYLYQEVSAISPSEDRGIKITKDFTEVVKTNAPACLIEISFHDNYDDARWIMENQNKIAYALCKGILKYFNIPMKTPSKIIMYRVFTGSFKDKENAFKRVADLKEKGFESWVMPVIL